MYMWQMNTIIWIFYIIQFLDLQSSFFRWVLKLWVKKNFFVVLPGGCFASADRQPHQPSCSVGHRNLKWHSSVDRQLWEKERQWSAVWSPQRVHHLQVTAALKQFHLGWSDKDFCLFSFMFWWHLCCSYEWCSSLLSLIKHCDVFLYLLYIVMVCHHSHRWLFSTVFLLLMPLLWSET